MRNLNVRNEGGFTLVELMIVIAIIGILAAIAIPQFAAYRERGFIASMEADARAAMLAEDNFFADPVNGIYTLLPEISGDASGSVLGKYGLTSISSGNTVKVTPVNDIKYDFLVTVTSDRVSNDKLTSVTFNSTTGEMKQNKP